MVNEYGDIAGLVTLEDILEEIVGEFTTDPATITHKDVHVERPGVYIVNASATIRALNRALRLAAARPMGRRHVNGLLLEQLETIPDPGTALTVGDYEFEMLQIADNAIRTVRVRRRRRRRPAAAEAASRSLLKRRLQRLADAATPASHPAPAAASRRVLPRHDRQLEALLLGLPQTLLAIGHRPHLARSARARRTTTSERAPRGRAGWRPAR